MLFALFLLLALMVEIPLGALFFLEELGVSAKRNVNRKAVYFAYSIYYLTPEKQQHSFNSFYNAWCTKTSSELCSVVEFRCIKR